MFVYNLLSVALAFLWSALAVSCAYIKNPCSNPVVRQEWRALSTDEKAEWIRAVDCLNQQPHDPALTPSVDPSVSLIPPVNASSSYYDDITYLHMDLNTRIHWTGHFLPWHRWYIHVFEKSLKEKCGFTGVSPYWNWTIDAADFYESSWWKDSDPVSGLGGWGDPNADFAVPDGAFHNFQNSYPVPHTIRRNFTLYPFNIGLSLFPNPQQAGNVSMLPPVVEALLETSAGDFKTFQVTLEAPEVRTMDISAYVTWHGFLMLN
jgi:tyrosinase